MKITVGTTAVRLPADSDDRIIIQNLGPGIVAIDGTDDVTVATGLQLAVDAAYEFPTDLNQGIGAVWLIADTADTDVRYMVIG